MIPFKDKLLRTLIIVVLIIAFFAQNHNILSCKMHPTFVNLAIIDVAKSLKHAKTQKTWQYLPKNAIKAWLKRNN